MSSLPLIALHGYLGRPGGWSAAMEALGAVSTSTELPDLPGHGPSPWLPRAQGFFGIVDELAERLPPRFHLAGYSMGARVALALALRHPKRVAAALLIGPNPGLVDEASRAERARWEEAQAVRLEHDGVAAFAEEWARLPLFASQRHLPPALLARQQSERLEQTAAGAAWAMRHLGLAAMPSLWPLLRRAEVPLRYLAGALEPACEQRCREAAALSEGATFRALPGAGHNLLLEAPAVVAEELKQLMTWSER